MRRRGKRNAEVGRGRLPLILSVPYESASTKLKKSPKHPQRDIIVPQGSVTEVTVPARLAPIWQANRSPTIVLRTIRLYSRRFTEMQ